MLLAHTCNDQIVEKKNLLQLRLAVLLQATVMSLGTHRPRWKKLRVVEKGREELRTAVAESARKSDRTFYIIRERIIKMYIGRSGKRS
jgi:hypothetical protein